MGRIDHALGVSVPALMGWANAHLWLKRCLNVSYFALGPMLLVAILLPALAGRRIVAQRFLTSNLIAFAIALPLFAAFPVVGPWMTYHFPATLDQRSCMKMLLTLRADPRYLFLPGTDLSIISFPSFHVIWALLSLHALWQFRWLRILAAVLAPLVVLSTMTTGWHYFADVIGGFAVAAISVAVADRVVPC